MLDVSRRGSVGIVTLRRPERRNAMDRDLVAALVDAFRHLDGDPETAAIVLGGDPPGFCAGSDLKFIGRLTLEDMCRFEAETGDMARLIGLLNKPVVAAVEGFALGGGFILAASCDLVVSATDARWHLPEVPIGWLTPWGLQALIARTGAVAARRLCFATEVLDAEEARRLVSSIISPRPAMQSRSPGRWPSGWQPCRARRRLRPSVSSCRRSRGCLKLSMPRPTQPLPIIADMRWRAPRSKNSAADDDFKREVQ